MPRGIASISLVPCLLEVTEVSSFKLSPLVPSAKHEFVSFQATSRLPSFER